MRVTVYEQSLAENGRQFLAIIERGPNLASFAFGSTDREAWGKAKAFVEAEDARSEKHRKPKANQAEIEEAL